MNRTSAAVLAVPVPLGSGPPGLTIRGVVAVGLLVQVSLLALVGSTAGLSGAAWAVGLSCGAVLTTALARGLLAGGRAGAGPADLVTLSRGLLACAAAALTIDSLLGREVMPALLALAVPALVLDAVDGWVARRTGTVTEFGGRFDGEVDAFLILVLSVYVAPSYGGWVLAAGLARYAFAVAGWVLPWMGGRLEYRFWRKVVTATASIVLTVAAADVLPPWLSLTALVGGLMLLAESFGRDVWWLWRRRAAWPAMARAPRGGRRHRPRAAIVLNVLALLLVWFALLSPSRPDHVTLSAFLRLPVEALVAAGLALVVSARTTRTMALVGGALLGGLTLLKVLDLGSFAVLDRPFNIVTDTSLLASGAGFVRDSVGMWAAIGAVAAALVLAGAIVVCVPLAVGRLVRLTSSHRPAGIRVVTTLAALWVACAVLGIQAGNGGPVAAADVGHLAAGKVRATEAALQDQDRFDEAVAADPLRQPGVGELAGLRGKDVVVAFVESYGRVAVEGPDSAGVAGLLAAGTSRLRASGYEARSAFLTSPTFGGSSWLAHATLKSGLWVDNQWRYDRLLSGDRTTLTSTFGRAGWRTVAVLPSNRSEWPEGQSFYDFDEVYDRTSLGYAGPRFGFSAIPDQYALSAFARLELGASPRAPLMAELDLTSSHGPWAPLPRIVDWTSLGDGSIFHGIRDRAVTAKELWSDRGNVPAAYRTSIVYSLTTLIAFVETYGNDDLVLVLLGDHQPSTIVSGHGANRDVPVTLIARDPDVIERISQWGWDHGMRPDEGAPAWRMDAFRDRFVAAYSDADPLGPFQRAR